MADTNPFRGLAQNPFVSQHVPLPVEEFFQTAGVLQNRFDQNKASLDALDLMARNLELFEGDDPIKQKAIDRVRSELDSIAKSGGAFEFAEDKIRGLAKSFASDKELKKAQINFEKFKKDQELLEELQAQGIQAVDLRNFRNRTSGDKPFSTVVVDEEGNRKLVDFQRGVQKRLDYDARKEEFFNDVLSRTQESKFIVDKSRGVIVSKNAQGISRQDIMEMGDEAFRRYKGTDEYVQESTLLQSQLNLTPEEADELIKQTVLDAGFERTGVVEHTQARGIPGGRGSGSTGSEDAARLRSLVPTPNRSVTLSSGKGITGFTRRSIQAPQLGVSSQPIDPTPVARQFSEDYLLINPNRIGVGGSKEAKEGKFTERGEHGIGEAVHEGSKIMFQVDSYFDGTSHPKKGNLLVTGSQSRFGENVQPSIDPNTGKYFVVDTETKEKVFVSPIAVNQYRDKDDLNRIVLQKMGPEEVKRAFNYDAYLVLGEPIEVNDSGINVNQNIATTISDLNTLRAGSPGVYNLIHDNYNAVTGNQSPLAPASLAQGLQQIFKNPRTGNDLQLARLTNEALKMAQMELKILPNQVNVKETVTLGALERLERAK